MSSAEDIFLDTSILIAKRFHGKSLNECISRTLAPYQSQKTGLIARQEYRRRLMGEAIYIYECLEKSNDIEEVYHRINRLPKQRERKKQICHQILGEIFKLEKPSDLTERFRSMVFSLLVNGLEELDQSVDQVLKFSQCALGRKDISYRKKKNGKIEFNVGKNKCSSTQSGECGIEKFITFSLEYCRTILNHLKELPEEKITDELKEIIGFLIRVIKDPSSIKSEDPCLTVGDLLIALESIGTKTFYTLNRAESIHLCDALKQKLIVRPTNPEKPDEFHDFAH